MEERTGLVLMAEVGGVKNRLAATSWLRELIAELDEAYGDRKLAAFALTQGDELQGLLAIGADPLIAVLHAALAPTRNLVRWVCVQGELDASEGTATQRTGTVFLAARKAMDEAQADRERLVLKTGEASVDDLLAGMAPALVELLDGLTDRQRSVSRLAIIDGLRQSEVADRLKIRRATAAVAFKRARVHTIERLAAAIGQVFSGKAPS